MDLSTVQTGFQLVMQLLPPNLFPSLFVFNGLLKPLQSNTPSLTIPCLLVRQSLIQPSGGRSDLALSFVCHPNPVITFCTSLQHASKCHTVRDVNWLISRPYPIYFTFFYIFSLLFQKNLHWIFTNIIPWFPLISRNNITAWLDYLSKLFHCVNFISSAGAATEAEKNVFIRH